MTASLPVPPPSFAFICLKVQSVLTTLCSKEQERFCLWAPVLIGFGILIYKQSFFDVAFHFLSLDDARLDAQRFYLLVLAVVLLCVLTFLGVVAFKTSSYTRRLLCLGMLFVGLGFQSMLWRGVLLQTPVLKKIYGPACITGVVEDVSHLSQKKGVHIILGSLAPLKKHFGHKPPPLQRVKIYLRKGGETLAVGQRISIKAKLRRISPPTWVRGYDFRRQAYYQSIGAKGFALWPPKVHSAAHASWGSVLVQKIRHRLEKCLYRHLQEPYSSIAVALLIGKKQNISTHTRDLFARSGVAHLLAISGLHMSIVAGLVFFVIQMGLSLVPRLSHLCALHKIAAVLTILMTFLYLQLSGGFMPATRAFLMTSVSMIAVLLDRSPFSMRLVAFAASTLLLLRPESLFSPSFQLSFAAVTALVAFAEHLSPLFYQRRAFWLFKNRFVLALCITLSTTVIAGLATMPYTIAFFHQCTVLGVVTNLVAIPLTTFLIMPLGLLFCALWPLGLEGWVAPFFNLALFVLYQLAHSVSQWPYASFNVPAAHPWCIGVVTVSGLWVLLWQSRLRWWGMPFLLAGFWGLFVPDVPDLWMDGEAKVLGFFDKRTQTLWTSSLRRGRFAQKTWLKASGARLHKQMPFGQKTQPAEGKEAMWHCDENSCLLKAPFQQKVLFVRYKGKALCDEADVVLSLEPLRGRCQQSPLKYDFFTAWRRGALGIWLTKKGPRAFLSPRP